MVAKPAQQGGASSSTSSWRQRPPSAPPPPPAPLTPIGEDLQDERRPPVDCAQGESGPETPGAPAASTPLPPAPVPAEPAVDYEIPWQVGNGKEEKAHLEPAMLADEIVGKLADEPWQFAPYDKGDMSWLAAAQRRHMHRRRGNASIGVASVDLSGPHIATPTHGNRIGQMSGRYFVVLVVRPDLSTATKSTYTQTEAEVQQEAGAAPGVHAGEGDEEGDCTYRGQPLVYAEIVGSKAEAGDAAKRIIAQIREEIGRMPLTLPEHWTVHRLHSDKGQELLPKSLDTFCFNHGIRRTTTAGYDPSANGAAEQAVGYLKRKARYLLTGARLSSSWWGQAVRTAAYYSRCAAGLHPWPSIGFGTRVMIITDPPPRDAFNPRSLPASVFGPSEQVPGAYVCYIDGKLVDKINVKPINMEAHELEFVKAHLEEWTEPAGVLAPAEDSAWDAAAAPDPSVPAPYRRRARQEAPAPEEQAQDDERRRGLLQGPGDVPGHAPGDSHLLDFDPDLEDPLPDEELEDAYEAARDAFAFSLNSSRRWASQHAGRTEDRGSSRGDARQNPSHTHPPTTGDAGRRAHVMHTSSKVAHETRGRKMADMKVSRRRKRHKKFGDASPCTREQTFNKFALVCPHALMTSTSNLVGVDFDLHPDPAHEDGTQDEVHDA